MGSDALSVAQGGPKLQRVVSQPENPFASLISDQSIAIVPSFTLESGVVLYNVPVAYTTRGKLNAARDNALVVCHALSGSADVSDWWGPLLGGPGQAFDTTKFFVVCLNSLGSPYGSASAVTYKDGDSRKDYVRSIVPIATSSRHSAWGISWGEAQRQSIYSDPKYEDGYYSFDDPPATGLGAARMAALLTYRSRNSFEARFGRNVPDASKRQNINSTARLPTPPNDHWAVHNDGHKSTRTAPVQTSTEILAPVPQSEIKFTDPQFSGATLFNAPPSPALDPSKRPATYFSAQSYLRYQGQKFVKRFDSNCYIAITRKLDTHDVSRHRVDASSLTPVKDALAQIQQPALVIGIESDGLFTFAEQQEIAEGIPNAQLRTIDSPEGHDAFLLQFEQVNRHILEFFRGVLPEIMAADGDTDSSKDHVAQLTKSSTFGEAEVEDITAW
ncbi:homoserine O-acetyltransferase [Coccidioides immitis RMSCC 3703]|uniref:Homoserine O-acetyltransferase n=1 Tax=Coccidioides immitis RMSCC 3703 TaxID=454286 RepID=A0A0J8R675_COCIT|nr:homoserine O-acetyltransferase [Coccidioides immitis RMSCC 3703]